MHDDDFGQSPRKVGEQLVTILNLLITLAERIKETIDRIGELGGIGKWSPAEVRMEDHAGGIDDRPQVGLHGPRCQSGRPARGQDSAQ